tara:strand:+ start:184 stop:462 length:279 start_codon:yes stop_codon:yes gene_type:complete
MKKHLKNIDLHKYDKAVKFLTRPFDNNLSFDQALAIQTLIDKVSYISGWQDWRKTLLNENKALSDENINLLNENKKLKIENSRKQQWINDCY